MRLFKECVSSECLFSFPVVYPWCVIFLFVVSDIPNVSEEATKDLDENGIVRIGARIEPVRNYLRKEVESIII